VAWRVGGIPNLGVLEHGVEKLGLGHPSPPTTMYTLYFEKPF
jgi:hypothetical protein